MPCFCGFDDFCANGVARYSAAYKNGDAVYFCYAKAEKIHILDRDGKYIILFKHMVTNFLCYFNIFIKYSQDMGKITLCIEKK